MSFLIVGDPIIRISERREKDLVPLKKVILPLFFISYCALRAFTHFSTFVFELPAFWIESTRTPNQH
jgi:hypothetical protein